MYKYVLNSAVKISMFAKYFEYYTITLRGAIILWTRCIWGAHWCHLANATELSKCGGDAALRQITLTTCLHYHYNNNNKSSAVAKMGDRLQNGSPYAIGPVSCLSVCL